MKKSVLVAFVSLSLILVLSIGMVSAISFSDWLKSVFGSKAEVQQSPALPGARNAGTIANEPNPNAQSSVGSADWEEPRAAKFDDGNKASIILDDDDISNYLKATYFNFSIPTNAIIKGITVEVKANKGCSSTACQIRDASVKIVKNGVISGNEKASAAFWNYTPSYRLYGGANDLWGLSWTPADINSANFGVAVSALGYKRLKGGKYAYIDYIGIKVDYTLNTTQTNQSLSCNSFIYNTPYAPNGNNYSQANSYAHERDICLQVLAPNTNATLRVGQLYNIQWKQKNVDSVSILVKSCRSCSEGWIALGQDVNPTQTFHNFSWIITKEYVNALGPKNLTIEIIGTNTSLGVPSTDGSDITFKVVNNSIPASCTDTDGGINYFVNGTARQCTESLCKNFAEACLNATVLSERFCSGTNINGTLYSCPNGCSNDACNGASLLISSAIFSTRPIEFTFSPPYSPYYVTTQYVSSGITFTNISGAGLGAIHGENFILSKDSGVEITFNQPVTRAGVYFHGGTPFRNDSLGKANPLVISAFDSNNNLIFNTNTTSCLTSSTSDWCVATFIGIQSSQTNIKRITYSRPYNNEYALSLDNLYFNI